MAFRNPFDAHEISVKYEAWYHTLGQQYALQEKDLLKNLLDKFPNAETMVELGCGTGYFTSWFSTYGIKTIGLDLSRNMLQETSSLHQLALVQGDAINLPFSRKSFDLSALITILEFVSDPASVLREAARVSRLGMLIGLINRHSLLGWRYLRKGGAIWGSAHLFTLSELKDLFSKSISHRYKIIYRTTLWPIYSGTSKLPWGGFIGLAVCF